MLLPRAEGRESAREVDITPWKVNKSTQGTIKPALVWVWKAWEVYPQILKVWKGPGWQEEFLALLANPAVPWGEAV